MPFFDLKDVDNREIVPGSSTKFIHSEKMTFSYWDFEAGVVVPNHTHPHEQINMVVDGEIEMTVGTETKHLKAGCVTVIPANVEHMVKTLTPCHLIDIFSPVREEYR